MLGHTSRIMTNSVKHSGKSVYLIKVFFLVFFQTTDADYAVDPPNGVMQKRGDMTERVQKNHKNVCGNEKKVVTLQSQTVGLRWL